MIVRVSIRCVRCGLVCLVRVSLCSVTFGVRKQLQAEQGIPELEAKVCVCTLSS